MEILYEIDFDKIKKIVFQKAPYQKVILCYDSSSNMEIVEKIVGDIKENTILLEYNFEHLFECERLFDDSIRCAISILSDANFLKLKKCLSENISLIDIYYENFASFHLFKNQGLLFLLSKNYNFMTEFLLISNYLVQTKFYDILSYKNYGKADDGLDKYINILQTSKTVRDIDFRSEIFVEAQNLFQKMFVDYNMSEIDMFLYVSILSYKYLFLSVKNNNYLITDIYKDYINDFENLNIAYEIVNNERIKYVLKNYADEILEMIDKILGKINIIKIKTKISINNILKIIKNNCKINKSDNLLKISYLYGIFNAI